MDFAAQSLTVGQINAIVKKLGGAEGALRFLRGELEVVATTVRGSAWWVWKSLTVGGSTLVEMKESLRRAQIEVGDYAEEMLFKMWYANHPHRVKFVCVSAEQLGLKEGGTLIQIAAAARTNGLGLCAADAIIALRLAYLTQPQGENLNFIVDQFVGSADRFGLVRVSGGSLGYPKLALNGAWVTPETVLEASTVFVFSKQ